MSSLLEEFRRYESLVESMLAGAGASAPTFAAEDAMAVQVERGLVFRDALLDPVSTDLSIVERLLEISGSDRLPALRIVDVGGNLRPIYRALLIYSWLSSFQLKYESLPRSQFGRWEESLHRWCELLEDDLNRFDWLDAPVPAKLGSSAAGAAWAALALFLGGKVFIRDAWTDLAADTFGRFAKRQLPTGSLLQAGAADNIETLGYHELAILHAIASYSVQAEDRASSAVVARATAHHARETQSDHATNQPWALFAFVWNESTRPIADQLLHASQINPDGVSLMLLADALYCLRLFTKPNP